MNAKKPFKDTAWQWQHRRFIALLVVVFVCIGLLVVRYDRRIDLTFNQRNALNTSSQAVVKQLNAPLTITAFTRGNPQVKRLIHRQIDKYRDYADIRLHFENPDTAIDAVREYNITRDGELLLSYQGKTALANSLNETTITRAIYTLLQDKNTRVLFITGHGERNLDNAENGYGALFERLKRQHMQVGQIDLKIAQTVPQSTDVLVIADPKSPYNNKEITAINDYINNGGRLLWLSEADSDRLPGLVSALGVTTEAATLINRSNRKYDLHNPTYVVIEPLPADGQQFPPLQTVNTMLLFPQISPVTLLPTAATEQWQTTTVLTAQGETFIKKAQSVEKADNAPIVARLLTAKAVEKPQKVVVIGDADFAANQFIGFGQNSDFAANLLRYLAVKDTRFITADDGMPPPVVLSDKRFGYLALVFVVAVPLCWLMIGFFVRRRLRRQS